MGQKKVNELKVGSIITYINLIISTIIPLLYTPIMLRILGQEEYGLYSLSNSVISYLTLLNFGFGTAIIRFISKFFNIHKALSLLSYLKIFPATRQFSF